MKFANIPGVNTENFVEKLQEGDVLNEDASHSAKKGITEGAFAESRRRGDAGYVNEREEDWGMGDEEESRTHPGEEDYTTKKGDELKHDEPGPGWGEKEDEEAYNEAVLAEDDIDVKELVTKLLQVISDETGVEAEVVGDDGEEVEGEEEFVGDELEGGDEDDMAPSDDVEDIEDLETDTEMVAEIEDLVSEVTRRVAKRLLKQ